MKLKFLMAAVLSLSLLLAGCTQPGDPVSPEEARAFEERAAYLFSEGIYPEFWWAEGSGAWDIGEDLSRPLDLQIPETEYYYVSLFRSIAELKAATEQAVTKEYAEKYLYPWGEKKNMFVEHEGELYANAYWEHTFYIPPPQIEFIRKEGDIVFLSGSYLGLEGDPGSIEIKLQKEDGVWKLCQTQCTEFFEIMLDEF